MALLRKCLEEVRAKHGWNWGGITLHDESKPPAVHRTRPTQAVAQGRFECQIVPIVKQTRKGEVTFDSDEHVNEGTTIDLLAELKPAIRKEARSIGGGQGIAAIFERL